MSGYEVGELVEIEGKIDALVSPTSEDVWQATRPYDARAIASVAATRAGSGDSGSQFLTARKTLTNDEIVTLKTDAFEILPATEVLDYSAEPTEMPIPLMAMAWLVKADHVAYSDVSTQAKLELYYGSDRSTLVGMVAEFFEDGTFNSYGGAVFNNAAGSWPMFFVIAPNFLGGANYQDNGIYLYLLDPDILDPMSGGNTANTLKVEIVYRLVTRTS